MVLKKNETKRCHKVKGYVVSLIFFSKTTGPIGAIGTKLGRNVHWMIFQKVYVTYEYLFI